METGRLLFQLTKRLLFINNRTTLHVSEASQMPIRLQHAIRTVVTGDGYLLPHIPVPIFSTKRTEIPQFNCGFLSTVLGHTHEK
jgi:hypothetical protein